MNVVVLFVGTSSHTTNLLCGVILLFKTLVQRSKINTINLHKEISASLCPVVGWRHEMNNPIRVMQVTRGLGGCLHRFLIMACYLHRMRVVCFLLFVTDTKWVVTESQVISFQGMKEEGWREERRVRRVIVCTIFYSLKGKRRGTDRYDITQCIWSSTVISLYIRVLEVPYEDQ